MSAFPIHRNVHCTHKPTVYCTSMWHEHSSESSVKWTLHFVAHHIVPISRLTDVIRCTASVVRNLMSEELKDEPVAPGGHLPASTCYLRRKHHCRSRQSPFSRTFSYVETFILWRWWSRPGYHHPHEDTDSFDEDENGRNYILLDSILHNHQNTTRGNIFWKNGVHLASPVPETGEKEYFEVIVLNCRSLTPTLSVSFPFNWTPS